MTGSTMKLETVSLKGMAFPLHSANTLVIGSGAAGLRAAIELNELGQQEVLMATDRLGAGTSFNAGSDKQTFYKLSLAGAAPDSPHRMAEDLFSGGCMHGDVALCEAGHSAAAFLGLVRMGVPFPHDRFGCYPGFKTDNDPLGRASSAGPLTSRIMCERLSDEVRARRTPVLDDHSVVALLYEDDEKRGRTVIGAVAVHPASRGTNNPFGIVLFNAKNIILATGGPAGIYEDSVYPESQRGSTGIALEIGAAARNLTESQFGIASLRPRWNLSGSYQQVVPRYVSTDKSGSGEKEFLNAFFPDMKTLAGAIFRKGYQWPFDAARVLDRGSSLIDLLVFRETRILGRRVFMDYTRNPSGPDGSPVFSSAILDEEARIYLDNSGALKSAPIERLKAMNPAACELYSGRGVDLAKDKLEIAVCAQHLNGGLAGNIWWESNIRHLFPVGEVNGSHGVRRPGGSALNAGQVGAMRAALFIASRYSGPLPDTDRFMRLAARRTGESIAFACKASGGDGASAADDDDTVSPDEVISEIKQRMTGCGAIIRERSSVARARKEAWRLFSRACAGLDAGSAAAVVQAFHAKDLCLTHALCLEAVHEHIEKGGGSRGGCLVQDREGVVPCSGLDPEWRFTFTEPGVFVDRKVLDVSFDMVHGVEKRWVDIRPVPTEDAWFEKAWSDYSQDRVIREEEAGDE